MTCTFENVTQDSLVVETRTVGGDGTFAFTSPNPQLGNFTLTTRNGVASRAFTGLAAGVYAISETVPAGWTLTSATCDNGDAPGNIRLAAGQTVRCTFVNQSVIMATDIPTLSEWGLLIFGVLLAFNLWWRGPMRAGRR